MVLPLAPSIAVGTFAAVVLAIASNRLHLTIAALLGTVVLMVTGVLSAEEASATINPGESTIALFFGGMVVARTLTPTGLFDYLGGVTIRFVRGDGRRLMLAIVVIAAPICAVLPNATVVILVSPFIIRLCEQMRVDFIQPIILLVFVANSAGLLTLVGDPATFIVGTAARLSFSDYLRLLSPGGVLALISVSALFPALFRATWQLRIPGQDIPPASRIARPAVMAACLSVLAVMITLFVLGERLSHPIGPPAVAVIGASLVLLIAYSTKLDDVGNILKDVDWETLLFLVGIFVMVGALDKTGVLGALGSAMGALFGDNVTLASLLLLVGVGVLSSVIPNVPMVVAMVPLVQQYAVGAGLATAVQMDDATTRVPNSVLPLFVAMCFGATLGGNATLIGAASNLVAGGICARAGRPLTFITFLRYGASVTMVQLAVSAAYVWLRFL
jgi:Na+/H+ antiporter NhaD/arsenite permease-like protein